MKLSFVCTARGFPVGDKVCYRLGEGPDDRHEALARVHRDELARPGSHVVVVEKGLHAWRSVVNAASRRINRSANARARGWPCRARVV